MVSLSENRIALVSTTRFIVEPVQQAAISGLPEGEFLHFVDEGILLAKKTAGEINSALIDWLHSILARTVASGASRAVVTCSSLSPAVRPAAEGVGIPVARIDYPLYLEVLKEASRPAVVMTNPTTEEPSRLLINEVREMLGEAVMPEVVLLDKAFERLNSGDPEGHDREVIGAVKELAVNHDQIILAQISIARVRRQLPDDIRNRVRSSLDFLPALIRGEYD